jgi:hypothetical protein
MRFIALALVCIGVLLATAGCDPVTDRQYMNEGAGVELGYPGLSEATQQQQAYVDQICQQAGYSRADPANSASSCMDQSGWDAFVLAGINDINRRCDGYLTWLDAKRRDREPVLSELSAITAATHTIMTVSGAGSDSLDIVTAALALAGATYTNWNSRLLLAVNQSTVQEIVYSRQAQFVEQLKGKHVGDRPTAIYLLRNYLRLCMPTTIEADINTSITLVQRGNPNDAKNNPVVQMVTPVTATQKVFAPARTFIPASTDVAKFFDEKLSQAEADFVLRALCFNNNSSAHISKSDLIAGLVRIYEETPDFQNPPAANGKISRRERLVIDRQHECGDAKNYFERVTFANTTSKQAISTSAGALKSFADLLNRSAAGGAVNDNDSLSMLRDKIAAVRADQNVAKNLKAALKPPFDKQVTPDLITALRMLPKPTQ